MYLTEYTIRYKSVSVPSYGGQTDIDISMGYTDEKWVINGQFGYMYEMKPVTINPLPNEVEKALSILSESKIPTVPAFVIGLDGTTYELEISNGLNQISYEWWGDMPDGFEPLKLFIDKLLAWVNFDPGQDQT